MIEDQDGAPISQALQDVIDERSRQISAEGWTPDHDDRHDDHSLAAAAQSYVGHYVGRAWLIEFAKPSDVEAETLRYQDEPTPDCWPGSWDEGWWKPKNPRRDLVRAAALIVAEIERLDREAAR